MKNRGDDRGFFCPRKAFRYEERIVALVRLGRATICRPLRRGRATFGGGTSEKGSHGGGWPRRAAEQIGLELAANGRTFLAFES